jgi:hypothetical protein
LKEEYLIGGFQFLLQRIGGELVFGGNLKWQKNRI